MLLALDIGNTNVTVGLFEGDRLLERWRLRTVHEQTTDEWGILLRNLFQLSGLDIGRVKGIAVASVVPPLDSTIAAMARRYFHMPAFFVSADVDLGLRILIDNPRQLGADRAVNGLCAYEKYGGPCVVVDLGTAITFDAVSATGDYLGGLICPGIGIAVEGLFERTAQLPLVDFQKPSRLIGTNTVASMQAGLYYGIVGLIDGILDRMIAELGAETRTVGTGGQAGLIVGQSRHLRQVDEDLTLEGVRRIWLRNNPGR